MDCGGGGAAGEVRIDRLLVAAKKPLPRTSPPQSAQSYDRDDVAAPLGAQRRELEHLRLELAGARGHIDALRTQVEVRSLEPIELREIVLRLEQQLVERDEELEKLRKALREGDAWRREVEAAEESLTRTVEALREELDLIKSTRLWRTGQRYWALKSRLRQLGRPGSS